MHQMWLGSSVRTSFGLVFLCVLEPLSGQCPDDWHYCVDSCYRVFKEREPYNTAFRRCGAYQSYLVTIKSAQENDFVDELTTEFADDQFWMGLEINSVPMYWMDDSSQVTWSMWRGHGPNLPPLCALMVRRQAWTSDTCSYLYRFVCEKPATTYESQQSTEHGPMDVSSTPRAERTLSTLLKQTYTVSYVATAVQNKVTNKTLKVTKATPPTTVVVHNNATNDHNIQTGVTTQVAVPSNAPGEQIRERVYSLSDAPHIMLSASGQLPATSGNSSTPANGLVRIVIQRNKNPGKTYPDTRPSAIGLGSFGICVLVFALLGVVLLDASKLFKDCQMLVRNLTHAWKRLRRFCKRVMRTAPRVTNECRLVQGIKLH